MNLRTTTFLGLCLCLLFFWNCQPEEDLNWNRKKFSFVQIENDPKPIETVDEVILSAWISDIEMDDQDPKPDPVTEYGHIYADDLSKLPPQGEKITLDILIEQYPLIEKPIAKGGSLFPDGQRMKFNSIIPATNLNKNTVYYFVAYVVRPSDQIIVFSQETPKQFDVPALSISSKTKMMGPDEVIEVEEIEDLKIRITGQIKEAKNVLLVEYGHRLLNYSDNMVIDSAAIKLPTPERLTGEREFPNELQLFDVNIDYYIQSYVIYQENENSLPITERDNILDEDLYRIEKSGFWINTANLKKKSAILPFKEPSALEDAVSFVLKDSNDKEYVYVGLGVLPNSQLNKQFWKFDPEIYLWEELPQQDDIPPRKDPVFFVLNNTAYIGWGFDEQGEALSDLWKMESDESWIEVSNVSMNVTEALEAFYKGPTVLDIDDSIIDAIKPQLGRMGTYSFSSSNNTKAFFGGGIGKEFKRIGGMPIDYAEGDCDTCAWNDFNNDFKIDWGEWVDRNGNGVIDAGIKVKNASEQEGISLYYNHGPNTNIPEDGIEIWDNEIDINCPRSDYTKVVKVEPIEIVQGTTIDQIKIFLNTDELNITEYDPTKPLCRSEWKDIDANKIIDPGEIEIIVASKWGLWESTNGRNWTISSLGDPGLRFGAIVRSIGTEQFHFGGAIDDVNFAQSYKVFFNQFGTQQDNIPNFRAVHGLAFVLNGTIYLGGGEEPDGSIKGLNLIQYTPSLGGTSFQNTTGCGLNALSRGVAFSARGRGFIGIGRINNDGELTNELWMYIPE